MGVRAVATDDHFEMSEPTDRFWMPPSAESVRLNPPIILPVQWVQSESEARKRYTQKVSRNISGFRSHSDSENRLYGDDVIRMKIASQQLQDVTASISTTGQ